MHPGDPMVAIANMVPYPALLVERRISLRAGTSTSGGISPILPNSLEDDGLAPQ